MEGGAKRPPTSFLPITSTNLRISLRNFLSFSFNPFVTLVQNFTFVLSASPKLLNLNQDHPSKKPFFWSNPYKIKVVITSLIQTLELPNFGHMNTSTIKFESRVKNFVGDVIDINYDVITFISKYCYFKNAWGSHFCWYHQHYNQVY